MHFLNKKSILSGAILVTATIFLNCAYADPASMLVTLVNNIKPNINYMSVIDVAFPFPNGYEAVSVWHGTPVYNQFIEPYNPSVTNLQGYNMCTDGNNGVCTEMPQSDIHVQDASCEKHPAFQTGDIFTVNGYSTCSKSGDDFSCQVYITNCTLTKPA